MKLMVRPWKSMVGRLLFGMPFTTNQRRDLLQGGVFVQRIRSSCEKLNSLTVRSRMPSSYKKVEFLLLLVLTTFSPTRPMVSAVFGGLVVVGREDGRSQHPETPPGGLESPQWKSYDFLETRRGRCSRNSHICSFHLILCGSDPSMQGIYLPSQFCLVHVAMFYLFFGWIFPYIRRIWGMPLPLKSWF